jgi:hypothetical protein
MKMLNARVSASKSAHSSCNREQCGPNFIYSLEFHPVSQSVDFRFLQKNLRS